MTDDPGGADWPLIRAFVSVMRTGSLTAAAAELGTTQPTVGRWIRALEAKAGDVLFLRRGTALEPTERARAMLPRALEVERAVADLTRDLLRGEERGRRIVRLTLPTLFADEMLPAIAGPLLGARPDADLQILPSDAVVDLYRRDADLALRLVAPTQPDLVVRTLGQVTIALYATRDYRERRGRPTAPADLAEHDLIGPVDDAALDVGARALGFAEVVPRRRLRTDDLRHRLALVRAGLGIGPCHDWIAATDPRLVRILPELSVARYEVRLVATDDVRRSKALRAMFDALAEAVRARLVR